MCNTYNMIIFCEKINCWNTKQIICYYFPINTIWINSLCLLRETSRCKIFKYWNDNSQSSGGGLGNLHCFYYWERNSSNLWLHYQFLGGLSLHLNHLIASRTYPRTYSGQFWNMSIFRWFKFTLKPPYSIALDNLRFAIWDTSFWTFWLKFGHKGLWHIS